MSFVIMCNFNNFMVYTVISIITGRILRSEVLSSKIDIYCSPFTRIISQYYSFARILFLWGLSIGEISLLCPLIVTVMFATHVAQELFPKSKNRILVVNITTQTVKGGDYVTYIAPR